MSDFGGDDSFDDFLGRIGAQPAKGGGDDSAGEYVKSVPVGSCQWSVMGDDKFTACGATLPILPSAVYKLEVDNNDRMIFKTAKVITDELIDLPDDAGQKVLESIKIFWNSKEKFKAKGQLYKRGVLLWGSAGSGKTSLLTLLSTTLIQNNGLVILCEDPKLTIKALEYLRRIEPERPLITIIEDIDDLVEKFSESDLLSLLDGENQIDNVVHLATTNYPEKLDVRFINRPSRFDEVIKVDMPSYEAREAYIKSKLIDENLSEEELKKWVEDTKGFSVAHLRELVVGVYCLSKDYDDTLLRLKKMKVKPKSESTDAKTGFSFDNVDD